MEVFYKIQLALSGKQQMNMLLVAIHIHMEKDILMLFL